MEVLLSQVQARCRCVLTCYCAEGVPHTVCHSLLSRPAKIPPTPRSRRSHSRQSIVPRYCFPSVPGALPVVAAGAAGVALGAVPAAATWALTLAALTLVTLL